MFFPTKNRLYISYKHANIWCRSVFEVQLPDWLTNYFQKIDDAESKCNLCDEILKAPLNSTDLLEHLKTQHKEIYEIHESNSDGNMGFRIEFLNFNVIKEDELKDKSIILSEMVGATETVQEDAEPVTPKENEVGLQYVLIERRKKRRIKTDALESRKRSWVWKYFDKLSNIIYRCNLCHVLLSIKGCNTNNMNRHVRSRHPTVFKQEITKRHGEGVSEALAFGEEVETPYAIKTEEIYASDSLNASKTDKESRKKSWVWKYFDKLSNKIYRCNLCLNLLSIKGYNTNNLNRHVRSRHPTVFKQEITKRRGEGVSQALALRKDVETPSAIKTEEIHASDSLNADESQKMRRSWIWFYFDRVSDTQAMCKLCKRNITHGGNATGNMNRHLKMIHNKTASDDDSCNSWVWKVIDSNAEDNVYTCRICQFNIKKLNDPEKNISFILKHLKLDHGVDSGDQIITSADWTV